MAKENSTKEHVIYTGWNEERGMTNYDAMMCDAFEDYKQQYESLPILNQEEIERREASKLRNDGSNYTRPKRKRRRH